MFLFCVSIFILQIIHHVDMGVEERVGVCAAHMSHPIFLHATVRQKALTIQARFGIAQV